MRDQKNLKLDMEFQAIYKEGNGRYRKPKRNEDEIEGYENKEMQKRLRYNVYQADQTTMKTDLLYDKFINRGGLMH